MRQIKFRAWSIKDNGWISGFNMVNFHSYYNKGLEPSVYRYGTSWKLSEIVLCQFTGLTDKNGKEIYEGDIVKGKESGYKNISIKGWDGYRTGEVVVKDGNTYYTVNGQIHQLLMHLQDCLILGNKFENPELLK